MTCAIRSIMYVLLMVAAGQAWCEEIIYQSPVMAGSDQAIFIDAPLAGARFLHLIVEDGGDSIAHDHADWGDAQLQTIDGKRIRLGDLTPLFKEQGFGSLKKDRSCDGYPLSIGRREFATGLGTHANSHIVYQLDGNFSRFTSYVGVDSSQDDKGSVVFKVVVSHEFVNPAEVPVPRGEVWWIEQSRSYDKIARGENPVDLVFLGDSITEGWRNEGRAVWSQFYGKRNAVNFGIGGDHTENTLWRIQNGNFDGFSSANPKLIVLMVGTNNSASLLPQYIAKGIEANINALRLKVPQSRILLLGIFPKGPSANDGQREALRVVNEKIANLADHEHVFYQDISGEFIEKDGTISGRIMPDYLHLSDEGYHRWATAIEENVARLIGN